MSRMNVQDYVRPCFVVHGDESLSTIQSDNLSFVAPKSRHIIKAPFSCILISYILI